MIILIHRKQFLTMQIILTVLDAYSLLIRLRELVKFLELALFLTTYTLTTYY